ncbi:hypothetical protein JW977_01015 [Candidatus Falkowbacteria bacterium]|nr:hypothetical protein [Candidatus Falkowbacteria bacterium]
MKKKILIVIIILVPISFLLLFILYGKYSYEKTITKCPEIRNIESGHYGRDISFEDCYGIISIDRWNPTISDTLYNFRDFKHDYYFAGINDLNGYAMRDSNLYIINKGVGKSKVSFDNVRYQYEEKYFINGEFKYFYYDKIEDIPIFLKVNTMSGEVAFYKSLDEPSESDRKIFEELEEVK